MNKDYGYDPIGNGMFRMVPSGDVVDRNERVPLRLIVAAGSIAKLVFL